jgi:hypothetical protein
MALFAAVVAFVVLFDPATAAHQLDDLAGTLRGEGLVITPLWVERAAVTLDRSEPGYVLALADLHEELGEEERAQAIRGMLVAKWRALEPVIASGRHPLRSAAAGGASADGAGVARWTVEIDVPAAAGLPVPPASPFAGVRPNGAPESADATAPAALPAETLASVAP